MDAPVMNALVEVGYVGIETRDPGGLDRYLQDVLGLPPGQSPAPGVSAWRMDGKVHRFLVHEGTADDVVYLGLEALDHEAFAGAVERLTAAGVQVTEGTEQERALRRVDALVWAAAPWGGRVEIVRGLAAAAEPFVSPLVPGGFVTEGVGFGHAVYMFPLGSPDGVKQYDASIGFVENALGMVLSDTLEMQLHGAPVTARFYHCNGRHHSIALIGTPAPALPRSANHIMIEARSMDDVGVAYDRALSAGIGIPMSLGRHDNDQMFSFYSTCPAGFEFEFGSDGVIVDDDWAVRVYDRISVWGHRAINVPAHPNR